WERESFAEAPPHRHKADAVPFLTRPPENTRVLLGYVRDDAHYRWIQETGVYNMRADDRPGSVGPGSEQLAAATAVPYGPSRLRPSPGRVAGGSRLLTMERMRELGYPNPRGTAYYCLPVEPVTPVPDWLGRLSSPAVESVVRRLSPDSAKGAPVPATWARLLAAAAVGN